MEMQFERKKCELEVGLGGLSNGGEAERNVVTDSMDV